MKIKKKKSTAKMSTGRMVLLFSCVVCSFVIPKNERKIIQQSSVQRLEVGASRFILCSHISLRVYLHRNAKLNSPLHRQRKCHCVRGEQ